jgi:hypothetical protein
MDDLISRTAAIEAAIDGTDDWDGGYNPERECYIIEHMANIPAVDAAPVVHARWILVQNGSGVCSACNRNDHIDSLAVYCRYCGAKMDGEQRLAFADQSGAEYADNPTV